MATPSINPSEGLGVDFYLDYFENTGVKAMVRASEKIYNQTKLTEQGLRVYELEFSDNSVPSDQIISDFIMICRHEIEKGRNPMAVHCRAGLGRSGTLVAAYLMFSYDMLPKEAIAWVRLCRPGSVIGA